MGRSLIPRASLQSLELSQQIVRASAQLPSSNAFTPKIVYVLPALGLSEIAVWMVYTGGSATGQVAMRVSFLKAAQGVSYNETIVDAALGVAQPFGRQTVYELERRGPIPGLNTTIRYVITVAVPRGATQIAFEVADLGTAPGTLSIELTGGN